MTEIQATPESYTGEPVRFPPLQVVDVYQESAAVIGDYRNQVLLDTNDHCLRLAVITGTYPWHVHPTSDELFFVLAGRLVIELEDGGELALGPGQAVTVPAGIPHRTRGEGRAVNLCFEAQAAQTEFLPAPGESAPGPVG
jgi:mannose-6-phosphate isomerase-like protein (cupin superfamily)